jgi:hypothetical protein
VIVKAGICVAYDWHLLKQSLPSLYNHLDAICLSVDKERKSWNGNPFELDWAAFTSFVQTIDKDHKIEVLEESFSSKARTPIQNECYQRNRMAQKLGKADWIVQFDTDEIFIDPGTFMAFLGKYQHSKRPLNIHGKWINLIKQTATGFIYSVTQTPPLATNVPVYEYGRTNGHFNIYTDTFLAHITWARPEEEVYFKLKNWGHSHEFNGMSFFKIWQALDDFNWRYIKDFHPMNKGSIPQLHFQEAIDISSLVQVFDGRSHQLSTKERWLNNIWISRLQKVFKKLNSPV